MRGHIILNIGEHAEKATPIFDHGKIWNIYILLNILMIIHVLTLFWPEKSIPMVNFTLNCFLGKFSTTPICYCWKILPKINIFVFWRIKSWLYMFWTSFALKIDSNGVLYLKMLLWQVNSHTHMWPSGKILSNVWISLYYRIQTRSYTILRFFFAQKFNSRG